MQRTDLNGLITYRCESRDGAIAIVVDMTDPLYPFSIGMSAEGRSTSTSMNVPQLRDLLSSCLAAIMDNSGIEGTEARSRLPRGVR